jgi:subtilisin family serine protease
LPSSNWGEQTVDIAAPGNDIISTLPDGKYGYMTGTSQATAFASGVAALVMANNPGLRSANDIKKYLTQTGDNDSKLAGKTRYQRRLNSYNALAIQDMDLAFNGVKVESNGAKKLEFPSSAADDDDMSIEAESKMANFGRMIQTHLSSKAVVAAPKLQPETASTEE